jgi:hypothetical protein
MWIIPSIFNIKPLTHPFAWCAAQPVLFRFGIQKIKGEKSEQPFENQ